MDKEIRLLSVSIEQYLSKSPLPAEVKRLVLAEQLQKVTMQAENCIQEQLQQEGDANNAEVIQQN